MKQEEIIRLIDTYKIELFNDGLCAFEAARIKKDNISDTIRNNKQEIIEYLMQQQEQKQKAYEEREKKISAIEGLNEIMECRKAWSAWKYDFNRMMETGCSYMTATKPEVSEKELREKYQRANAYLIALEESNKSNNKLSSIGETAVERIINGENYELVLNNMNAAIKRYTEDHAWD